jgi:hypothetical protein
MPSYPYAQPISGLEQIINHLRKSPLPEINASRLKSLGIAPNNESYILNTLRALGLYDTEGKAVSVSMEVFYKSDDTEFSSGFAALVKNAYGGLFDVHTDAWTIEKPKLVSFFRAEDKSSDLVGNRQADTFIKLAEMAQQRQPSTAARPAKPRTQRAPKEQTNKKQTAGQSTQHVQGPQAPAQANEHDMALTVRIEVNLPPGGDQSTYDLIFKSIRENLIDRG